MEKVGEYEEKTIGEASNSTEETRSDKEDERMRDTITERFDPVDYTEEGFTDPSTSQTVTFKEHDASEYEMEDEEVLQLFRRNSGLRPTVAMSNNFPYLNTSEEMLLQFQDDTPAETEQTDVVFHSMSDSSEIADLENLDSSVILEEVRSSSVSEQDTDDSSSDSDLDSSLSRYYFDGSLPVSAHVEESETHQDQDESHAPKDENQMPLLYPKQPLQQLTSWRNCCGLLELLWAADT